MAAGPCRRAPLLVVARAVSGVIGAVAMGCQRYRNSFTAYLQGELTPARREAMERHLQECRSCARDLHTLSQTVALVRSLPVVAPRPVVAERLRVAIQAEPPPMSWLEQLRFEWRVAGRRRQARAWGVGLAATVLLSAVGASTLDSWGTHQSEPLSVGIDLSAPRTPVINPLPEVPAPAQGDVARATARVVAFPQTPMVAGAANVVYFTVESSRDLANAELRLYPPAGVALAEGSLQEDASYLVFRGAVAAGNAQQQWVAVRLRPAQAGGCALRVVLSEDGRVIADEQVFLNVMAAPH